MQSEIIKYTFKHLFYNTFSCLKKKKMKREREREREKKKNVNLQNFRLLVNCFKTKPKVVKRNKK
jgi:hypothetical protein